MSSSNDYTNKCKINFFTTKWNFCLSTVGSRIIRNFKFSTINVFYNMSFQKWKILNPRKNFQTQCIRCSALHIYRTEKDFADRCPLLFSEGWVQNKWWGFSCHWWCYKISRGTEWYLDSNWTSFQLLKLIIIPSVEDCVCRKSIYGYHWTCEFYAPRKNRWQC